MARLHVVAIAARLPAWAETACAEYARRMPKGYEVERLALKDESRLRAAMPKGARLVALDERGREFTTAQFAKLLQAPSAFVIGGADGLSDATKREAQKHDAAKVEPGFLAAGLSNQQRGGDDEQGEQKDSR